MAQVSANVAVGKRSRIVPLTVVLATSFMASACAQLGGDLTPKLLASQSSDAGKAPDNRSELLKATEYWGKAFAKNPNDPDAAFAYAKNLKAMGRKAQALSVLQHALSTNSDRSELVSEYGRLALDLGKLNIAEKALKHADVAGRPDWKTISARGALLARKGKFDQAIPEFERALALSNENPSVLNNLGMAYVLGGDPVKAEGYLRRAMAANASSKKIQKNLALALGLQGRYDESKQLGALAQNSVAANSDTETLRKLVRLPETSVPSVAPTRVVARASHPAAPQLKPASNNDAENKWDKLVAMAKTSKVDLRGSSK